MSGHPLLNRPSEDIFSGRKEGGIITDNGFLPLSALGGGGGGFDGATQFSHRRGYVVFPQLDTRKEINHTNRREILKKSRWLYNNHGTARRIVRGVARLIGAMSPKPITPDRKWNSLAKRYFKLKTETPQAFDASGKYGFRGYQLNLSRLWLKDGDSLTAYGLSEDGSPRVKCFEGHQIGDLMRDRFARIKSTRGRERAWQWFDGVLVGRDNQHGAYRVLHPDDPDKGKIIPANQAHLYTLFERPGQPRGIGALHHAVNHMLDLTEIVADVKLAIKNSAQIGYYLTGVTDSPTQPGSRGIARDVRRVRIPKHDDEGTADTDESEDEESVNIEDVFGASHIPKWAEWKPGVLADPRPHPNNVELMRWLIREVCLGLDFPPEIIWELGSLNGNVVRVLNEDCQESLDAHRVELNIPFCQRTWFNVIGLGIATGELPEPEIPAHLEGLVGWWSVEWNPPPRKTIDRGREGRLAMEERSRFMRTLDRHFTETFQSDWSDETSQFLDEIEVILDMAEERKWPESRVRMLEAMLLASPPGTAAVDAANTDQEPPDPKQKKSSQEN